MRWLVSHRIGRRGRRLPLSLSLLSPSLSLSLEKATSKPRGGRVSQLCSTYTSRNLNPVTDRHSVLHRQTLRSNSSEATRETPVPVEPVERWSSGTGPGTGHADTPYSILIVFLQ